MLEDGISRFIRRLQLHGVLGSEDIKAIHALPWRLIKRAKHSYVLRDGDLAPEVSVLATGYAQRQKVTSDGTRQIVSFSMPGDPLDFDCLFLAESDMSVQMSTNGTVAIVRSENLNELLDRRPAVARAVTTALVADAAIFREWVVNTGRRDARQRIAHVLCEILTRADAQRIPTEAFELPYTQEQLADATGLTPVHVNRVLRQLDNEGVISRNGRFMKVPDRDELEAIAGFDDRFLHMRGD